MFKINLYDNDNPAFCRKRKSSKKFFIVCTCILFSTIHAAQNHTQTSQILTALSLHLCTCVQSTVLTFRTIFLLNIYYYIQCRTRHLSFCLQVLTMRLHTWPVLRRSRRNDFLIQIGMPAIYRAIYTRLDRKHISPITDYILMLFAYVFTFFHI